MNGVWSCSPINDREQLVEVPNTWCAIAHQAPSYVTLQETICHTVTRRVSETFRYIRKSAMRTEPREHRIWLKSEKCWALVLKWPNSSWDEKLLSQSIESPNMFHFVPLECMFSSMKKAPLKQPHTFILTIQRYKISHIYYDEFCMASRRSPGWHERGIVWNTIGFVSFVGTVTSFCRGCWHGVRRLSKKGLPTDLIMLYVQTIPASVKSGKPRILRSNHCSWPGHR